jgi:hypothetical protein
MIVVAVIGHAGDVEDLTAGRVVDAVAVRVEALFIRVDPRSNEHEAGVVVGRERQRGSGVALISDRGVGQHAHALVVVSGAVHVVRGIGESEGLCSATQVDARRRAKLTEHVVYTRGRVIRARHRRERGADIERIDAALRRVTADELLIVAEIAHLVVATRLALLTTGHEDSRGRRIFGLAIREHRRAAFGEVRVVHAVGVVVEAGEEERLILRHGAELRGHAALSWVAGIEEPVVTQRKRERQRNLPGRDVPARADHVGDHRIGRGVERAQRIPTPFLRAVLDLKLVRLIARERRADERERLIDVVVRLLVIGADHAARAENNHETQSGERAHGHGGHSEQWLRQALERGFQ